MVELYHINGDLWWQRGVHPPVPTIDKGKAWSNSIITTAICGGRGVHPPVPTIDTGKAWSNSIITTAICGGRGAYTRLYPHQIQVRLGRTRSQGRRSVVAEGLSPACIHTRHRWGLGRLQLDCGFMNQAGWVHTRTVHVRFDGSSTDTQNPTRVRCVYVKIVYCDIIQARKSQFSRLCAVCVFWPTLGVWYANTKAGLHVVSSVIIASKDIITCILPAH